MMTLVAGPAGIHTAIHRLRAGRAVILPLPSPLPYTVVATVAGVVNTTKNRPADQPVGLSVADIDDVAPFLDLVDHVQPIARWLCEVELASLLVPVRPAAPDRLAPAISDDRLFFCATPWRPDLADILQAVGPVFMSSGNTTGNRVATTAAEAAAAFPDVLVLDGDADRDPERAHGSTTVLALDPDGAITLHRSGISDAGQEPDRYLENLRHRLDERARTASERGRRRRAGLHRRDDQRGRGAADHVAPEQT